MNERAQALSSAGSVEAGPSVESPREGEVEDARTGTERMVAASRDRLASIHRKQVHRDPWPDFSSFDPSPWTDRQRRDAALQWAGRGRNEYGSIHQFSEVAHALATARIEAEVLGCLARLITDEVRHAELCSAMALAVWPEGRSIEPAVFRWPRPRAPWPAAPKLRARERDGEAFDDEAILAWAAGAILTACCLGETLSKPMLEALAVVSTEPLAEAVSRQILRDEHLHATFGWETLALLLPRLKPSARQTLQDQLSTDLRGFERSVCLELRIADVAGREITIERGEPNLGVLTNEQYTMMFYACLEGEIFPNLEALGFDPAAAWAAR